jgi:hypothetical protein
MGWLRWPPAHFAALGVVLFALDHYAAPSTAPRPTVVITAARLEQLAADARRASKAAPDEGALVDRAIDEEILFSEALARGLDRGEQSVQWRLTQKMRFLHAGRGDTEDDACGDEGETGSDPELFRQAVALKLDQEDPVVRGFLVQKMRYLLKRTVSDRTPDDVELRAYLERHRDRYLQPAQVTFWHVFLSTDQRAAGLDREARQLLDRLSAQGTPPAEAVRLGDLFPLGAYRRAQSAPELARFFGPEFARAVLAVEPGAWDGPVRSAFGLHLVWVEETQPPRMPQLESVRSRVLADWTEERRTEHLAEEMRTLRAKYAVRVESRTGGQG